MRISDWSSDVCSSDLVALQKEEEILKSLAQRVLTGSFHDRGEASRQLDIKMRQITGVAKARPVAAYVDMLLREHERVLLTGWHRDVYDIWLSKLWKYRSEEHTSELQSLMRNSYAVFCLKKTTTSMIYLRRSTK